MFKINRMCYSEYFIPFNCDEWICIIYSSISLALGRSKIECIFKQHQSILNLCQHQMNDE